MQSVHQSGARAIAPDLRGFGGSRGRLHAVTVEAHADDLATLLDHLNVDSATVVGLSMGGYVALAFARRHPTRLRALLLADTKATPDTPDARAMRDVNIGKANERGAIAIYEAMIPKAFSPSTGDEVKNELRSIAREQPVDGVIDALRAMRDREDATPFLASISVPTRVVVGEDDLITPPSDARLLADSIPNATFQSIERAGHLSNVERPEEFTRSLLSLL